MTYSTYELTVTWIAPLDHFDWPTTQNARILPVEYTVLTVPVQYTAFSLGWHYFFFSSSESDNSDFGFKPITATCTDP